MRNGALAIATLAETFRDDVLTAPFRNATPPVYRAVALRNAFDRLLAELPDTGTAPKLPAPPDVLAPDALAANISEVWTLLYDVIHQRGTLVIATDGGERAEGLCLSAEARAVRSQNSKAFWQYSTYRAKMSARDKVTYADPALRAKRSA